jgi:hypothetical protein
MIMIHITKVSFKTIQKKVMASKNLNLGMYTLDFIIKINLMEKVSISGLMERFIEEIL